MKMRAAYMPKTLICLSDKINILSPFTDYAIISTVSSDLSLQANRLQKELLSRQASVKQSFFNTGIGSALQNLPLKY